MIRVISNNEVPWESFLEHLKEANMYQHLDLNNPDYFYIIKLIDNRVVGHITILKKPLIVPTLELDKIKLNDKPLFEYYVQTFYVNNEFRNEGIGSCLQNFAFQKAKESGAYQLRSWSSYDKESNYHLKLKLGFSIHPSHTYVSRTNQYIPGVYFIKKC